MSDERTENGVVESVEEDRTIPEPTPSSARRASRAARARDINFMGLRKYFIGLSFLLILGTIFAINNPGPKWGTDFRGGTEVEINFLEPVDGGALRAAIAKHGFESPEVVSAADDNMPNRYIVRVKEVSSLDEAKQAAVREALCLIPEEDSEEKLDPAKCPPELQTEEVKFSPGGDKITARYAKPNPEDESTVCGEPEGEVKCPPLPGIQKQLAGAVTGIELRAGANNRVVQNPRDNRVEFYLKSKGDQIMDDLREELGAKVVPAAPLRIEWVGPKAGKQLRDAAIKSITIAIIFIMIYIAFRFDMRFAPGAIAALVHDVFIAMGLMILAQREVTLSTVAAMLTIVGYSINDTVVVYDRIRENLGRYRKMGFPEIINRSITEMMGRTIRTSVSTVFALAPFLVIGTGVIRDFAFTMTCGVVIGTYSSLYVAAPLTEFIDRKVFGRAVKKKRRIKRKKRSAASRAAASV